MNKNDVTEELLRLDSEVFLKYGYMPERAKIVVVGGAAFLMRDLTSRKTHDIDFYSVDGVPGWPISGHPNINTLCYTFTLCIPYGYEERLERLDLDTMTVDYFTPSQEDLAVMKLYRYERNDQADLGSDEFLRRLNWGTLHHLINDSEEAMASRIALPENDREYKNLLHNYERYKEEFYDGPEL